MIEKIAYSDDVFGDFLSDAASNDGRFMLRLRENWLSGERRFDLPGEALLGEVFDNRLISVGGVSLDPYTDEAELGRVRHFYVLSTARRRGFGRRLLNTLLEHGRWHFPKLRLSTSNSNAAAMYEAAGFRPSIAHKETHRLVF
jgi:GNAT superfamily N-acetyltransferase